MRRKDVSCEGGEKGVGGGSKEAWEEMRGREKEESIFA